MLIVPPLLIFVLLQEESDGSLKWEVTGTGILRSTHSTTNLLDIHAYSQTIRFVRIINFAKAHCFEILHTDNSSVSIGTFYLEWTVLPPCVIRVIMLAIPRAI